MTKCCGQWHQKLKLELGNYERKMLYIGAILARKCIFCKD